MATPQDLGLVTAYGYAKAGGYTGTEDQFQTLLGSIEKQVASAEASAQKAKEEADRAFDTTPEGYELVSANAALAPINRDTLGYSVKNLVPCQYAPGYTTTSNGITWTVNDDYSITANGTATAESRIYYCDNGDFSRLIAGKKYTLTGCPTGGSKDTYLLFVRLDASGTALSVDYGSGVSFTWSTNLYNDIYLVIKQGVTANNMVWLPMIRSADIEDSTYEPYRYNVDTRLDGVEELAKRTNTLSSTFELGDTALYSHKKGEYFIWKNEYMVKALSDIKMGYGISGVGKNLLKCPFIPGYKVTTNGVTFTVNDDYSITANGTATALVNLRYPASFTGINGSMYIVSGCPSGGSNKTYSIAMSDYDGAYDYGNEYTLTITSAQTKPDLYVFIYSGYTASNLTFYPMIRLATQPAGYIPYGGPNVVKTTVADELARANHDYHLYTIHIDGEESDPKSKVTYKDDAVNMTPAYMDYQNGTFNYGSWKDAFFMPKSCLIGKDGTFLGYLDEDNNKLMADGTEADFTNANAMMEWGRGGRQIWTKITPRDTWENLLDCSVISTKTEGGVTFTVNKDGDGNVKSIVANGTATARIYFNVANNLSSLVNGKSYILTGCPSGGSVTSGYALAAQNNYDEGSGVTFTCKSDGGNVCTIVIANGYTVSNLTFTPMIREASSYSKATFVPYGTKAAISADISVCDVRLDQDFHAWTFHNHYGKLMKHHYTPKYNGSLVDDCLRSIPGQAVMNKKTAQQEIDYAVANNQYETENYVKLPKSIVTSNDVKYSVYNSGDNEIHISGGGASDYVIDLSLEGPLTYKISFKATNLSGTQVLGINYPSGSAMEARWITGTEQTFTVTMDSGYSNKLLLYSLTGATFNDVTVTLKITRLHNEWFTETYADWMERNILLMLMGKSTEMQSVFGTGIQTGSETAFNNYRTGTLDTKGLFWGSNDSVQAVKAFGMENPWALQWQRIAGYGQNNGSVRIKNTYGTEDGSTAVGYNINLTGYKAKGCLNTINSGRYVKDYFFLEDGMTPKSTGGGLTTYYGDGAWQNNNYNPIYAIVGGRSNDGALCGPLYVALSDSPGGVDWGTGAAASFRPMEEDEEDET